MATTLTLEDLLSVEQTGATTRVMVSVPHVDDDTLAEAEALASSYTGLKAIDLIAWDGAANKSIEVHLQG